jgi:hypothetical protein
LSVVLEIFSLQKENVKSISATQGDLPVVMFGRVSLGAAISECHTCFHIFSAFIFIKYKASRKEEFIENV